MRYFENFPLVWHTITDTNDQVLLANICRRVQILDSIRDLDGVLLSYNIADGETPRAFAERVYGSFELFWIVPLINRRFDLATQWPRPQERVLAELEEAYGIEGMYLMKHYVNEFGVETDPTALRIQFGEAANVTDDEIIAKYGLTKVSYHDDAIDKNNQLRAVSVLDSDYVTAFVNQLESELAS